MDDLGTLLLPIGGVIALISLLLVAHHYSRKPLASVSLDQPGPFTLAVPPTTGPVEIWIRYSVAFPYYGPFGREPFALVVELVADGHREVRACGTRKPEDVPRFDGGVTRLWMSHSLGSPTTMGHSIATRLVRRLPSCPRTLHGSVSVSSGSTLHSAVITLKQRRW